MEQYAVTEEVLKPPVASVGVLGWMRKNLFNSIFNSILTLLTIYLLWEIVPPFVKWRTSRKSLTVRAS